MWIKKSCFALAFMILLAGCSVKKPTESTVVVNKEVSKAERKRIWTGLEEKRIIYDTFSGKAKTKLSINNKSFNATSTLRIKHGESIWISITAILGIEVARVLITPDRIQIINRIQNEYIDKPFDYVYRYTSQEMGFDEIEDLLVGNILSFGLNPNVNILSTSDGFEIQGQHLALDFSMLVGNNYKVNSAQFNQKSIQQTLSSSYDNFEEIIGQQIPRNVQILLVAPKLDLSMLMNYNNVALNEDLNFSFQVPSGYKQSN